MSSMLEPPDPAQGTPAQPSATEREDPSGSEASTELSSPPSGPIPASPGLETGVESTIADAETVDITRVLPPPTAVAVAGSSRDARDTPFSEISSEPQTERAPDDAEGQFPGRPSAIAGYEILGVLGRGAMGVVYKARQRGLKRVVALKMISAGTHSGPDELARFRSEAVAAAELQHPNIVQIYEVGEESDVPFFSLEYVEGGSLARKIDGTPQPTSEAAHLVCVLAEAMEYAHRRGIIHRDLKPANILLTADGMPKISDFGLAKRLADDVGQTLLGSILGSPGFMAPEQAAGQLGEIGPRSDVYGLGSVLYNLLTGRPPFRAASVLDTLQQVKTQEPIAPSQFQPKLPRDLETICLKCLQKDPALRYATAGDLAEDLRRFEAGKPIVARPVALAERLWRWCRRNPRAAAMSGAIVLLVVGWAVTSTVLYRRAMANQEAAVLAAAAARWQEALALENAAEARRNADQAQRSADLARRREESARATAQSAITQMIHLGDQVLGRLRAKHDPPQAETQWLRLRDDLIALMAKEMVAMAQQIERQEVISFAVVATHQQLGDLLRKFGKGEDARRQFRRACDLLDRIVAAQPDNDVARANLGVMLQRLGETALDLDGDAARARGEFQRSWDLQQQIAEHPRSGYYKDVDNHRLLSHAATKQGLAELSLGHPTEARDRFQAAWEHRTAWLKAKPQDTAAYSYLSQAELWLGVASSHLDDWPAARPHFERAIAICQDLIRRFPTQFHFRGDLADVNGAYAEALARLGKDVEAEQANLRSLQCAEEALAHDEKDTAERSLMAAAHERLAAIALLRNQPAEAEKHRRAALEIRAELAQVEPGNLPRQAMFGLALAHCSRRDEARGKAEELLHKAADRPAILLPLARTFAACATSEPDADRRRDLSRMTDVLAAAVHHGYRDVVVMRTDPDLALFQTEPAFQALLHELEAKR
jgi:tetratricopeptide (TPR) repeat protein/predicted Ser/Thr protein kinase